MDVSLASSNRIILLNVNNSKVVETSIETTLKGNTIKRRLTSRDSDNNSKVVGTSVETTLIVHGPDQNLVSPRWTKPNGFFLIGVCP